MTGYESKKKAAQAKTIDEVNWVDHELDGLAQPAQEPLCYASINKQGDVCSTLKQRDSWRTVPLYTTPPQPAQEPVATLNISRFRGHLVNHDFDYFGELPNGTHALYTTPPQRTWVGLTAEEAAECWTTSATQTWKNFEAKLKDKNNG